MNIPANIGSALLMLTVSALSVAMILKHKHAISKASFAWALLSGLFAFVASGFYIAAPDGGLSKVLILLALFIMIPMFPFNGLYLGVFAAVPARISSFMALLMPLSALSVLLNSDLITSMGLIMHNSGDMASTLKVLATIGVIYGAIRALTQIRVAPLLGYGSVSIYSLVWIYIFNSEKYMLKVDSAATMIPLKPLTNQEDTIIILILSTAVSIAAMLYAWSLVTKRYDDIEISKVIGTVGGLINTMPRLTAMFTLLFVAIAGLPPFGLFTGYIMAVFSPASLDTCLPALTVTMLAFSSWYFTKLLQRIFFGEKKDDSITIGFSRDITFIELIPLLLALSLLLSLGLYNEWIVKGLL